MSAFITSDLHIGHNKEFLYNPRGFDNIYDHDRALIKNWNNTVADDDIVYVLGDLMLGDNAYGCSTFNHLNGRKIIILGNHDTDTRRELYPNLRGVVEVTYATVLKYEGYHFYLSHYGALTSNHDYDKPLKQRLISLCGHTHTKDRFADWDKGYIYHCELDAHDMRPINIDQIIRDIEEKNSIV